MFTDVGVIEVLRIVIIILCLLCNIEHICEEVGYRDERRG